MKSTTFKLISTSFETKGKDQLAETDNLISLLQATVKLLNDLSFKSLLIVNSHGIVKFYWKRQSPEAEMVLVESIYGEIENSDKCHTVDMTFVTSLSMGNLIY